MVIKREEGVCQRCGQMGWERDRGKWIPVYDMEVNHLTYENRGDEKNNLSDLELLCRDCHKKYHRQEQLPPPIDDDVRMNDLRNAALEKLRAIKR